MGPSLAPPPPNARPSGRVGAWYMVTPQEEGVDVAWQKEMVDKAEPKVNIGNAEDKQCCVTHIPGLRFYGFTGSISL